MVDPAVGPSPLIPFLIVITLWFIIYGHSVVHSLSLVSQFEKVSLHFVVIMPLLVMLSIYLSSESIIVPVMLVLVVYMVSKMLLGPIILILFVYIVTVWFGNRDGGGDREADDERDGGDYENLGWGCVLSIVMFIVLFGMFYRGEGYDWRTALLVVVIYVLYNLFWV